MRVGRVLRIQGVTVIQTKVEILETNNRRAAVKTKFRCWSDYIRCLCCMFLSTYQPKAFPPLWCWQNALHRQVRLFVGDLFKHRGNWKWETHHISCSSIACTVLLCAAGAYLCSPACTVVSRNLVWTDFVSLCWDVPLRCRLTFLFPWLAVKGPLQRREIRADPAS